MFYRDMKTRRLYRLYRQFWEVGWVTTQTGIKKLDARQVYEVHFLRYADNHPYDTSWIYNHDTNSVINTRDIKWSDWHDGTNEPTVKHFIHVQNIQLLCIY